MVKIEELLEPDESVLKKQRGVQAGRGFGSLGTLYLTNKRVIFIPNKLLTAALGIAALPTAAGAGALASLFKKGLHIIPLSDIKEVKSSFGALVIVADKKYTYSVSMWKTKEWVNAVKEAMAMAEVEEEIEEEPVKEEPRPRTTRRRRSSTRRSTRRRRPRSTKAKSAEVKFCPECGAKVRPTDNFCPNCGHKLR